MKNIYFIIISVLFLIYVTIEIKKKKLSIKESFWWVIASLIMLILSIFPYSIDYVAKWLNISYPPSLLFVLCFVFTLFIVFRNNKKISEQQEKIIELEQHLAIIESNNHEKKKN